MTGAHLLLCMPSLELALLGGQHGPTTERVGLVSSHLRTKDTMVFSSILQANVSSVCGINRQLDSIVIKPTISDAIFGTRWMVSTFLTLEHGIPHLLRGTFAISIPFVRATHQDASSWVTGQFMHHELVMIMSEGIAVFHDIPFETSTVQQTTLKQLPASEALPQTDCAA